MGCRPNSRRSMVRPPPSCFNAPARPLPRPGPLSLGIPRIETSAHTPSLFDSGRYLKENATEVEGTFRVSGSSKRMKDIQAIFDAPPKVSPSTPSRQRPGLPFDRILDFPSTASTSTGPACSTRPTTLRPSSGGSSPRCPYVHDPSHQPISETCAHLLHCRSLQEPVVPDSVSAGVWDPDELLSELADDADA